MSKIKLSIDGTEYEFYEYEYIDSEHVTPTVTVHGKRYIGKAIPKDTKPIQDKDWEIVSFINRKSYLLKHTYATLRMNGKYLNDYCTAPHGLYTLDEMFKNTDWEIYCVRLIIDNQIFTLKDVTNYGIIESFNIGNDGWMIVHFTDGCGATLNSIEHKPKAMFTKEEVLEIINKHLGYK